MNAEQARLMSVSNFEEINNEKIKMILDKVAENASKGKFSAFFDGTKISNDEERHLEELGYKVEIIYAQVYFGRMTPEKLATMKTTDDLKLSW